MSRFAHRLRPVAALVAWLVLAVAPPISAQSLVPISEIVVEGTQRIDPDTVRSYLLLRPGDTVDPERADRALKALFATGLFADVQLTVEGSVLVARVVENPIINRIQFEGNRRVNDDTLRPEVQLRPRVVYTRAKVQADVKRVLDLYRRSGRFAATVDPKVIQLPQNRVDLVFEIDEGQVTGVRRIAFVGNDRFSDSRLRDTINTKESRWWRFLTASDTYDPDRLSFDRELLRKFYLAQGYADFRVVSAVAELTPDREAFFITFTIEEGERYKFAEINVVSQIKDLKTEQLQAVVTAKAGEWYDADRVDESITKMTTTIGSLGYAFVDIRPRVTRDRDARTIAVTFEVQEGPRVYVDRINITGNARTLDKVIRREITIAEGDAFNTAKLRRSRQRVRNLGFFEKVEVTNVPGDQPDRTVVNVDVQEKSTGEITFGVGFSTSDGPLADVRLRERNLLGRGQDFQAGVVLAGQRSELDFSFTEPYFLDRPLSAGFDLFAIERDFQKEASYDLRSYGFTLRSGFMLSENLRQTVRYTLRSDDITNVQDNASFFIKEQEGLSVTSLVGYDLMYDRRDDRFDPTDGYFIRWSQDFAGLGGDNNWIRNRIASGYYYAVTDDWIANVGGEVGYIFDYGDPVRINQRFYLGGDNLRGFKTAGVGPRDTSTNDALGGNKYYTGTIGLSFPSGLPKEIGIRGLIFTDMGSLWDTDSTGPTVADINSLRLSIGVGVAWRSPFGPIRMSLSQAVLKENFDRTELFRFSFGSRF